MFLYLTHDLLDSLRFDLFSTLVAVAISEFCIQQSQIIIYFRQCSDRASRISSFLILFYRYGRGKSATVFDIGSFSQIEKLSQIRAQRFYVSILSFLVDSIEGERRFSWSGNTRDSDQFIFWYFDIDILQIMSFHSLKFYRCFESTERWYDFFWHTQKNIRK